MPTNIFLWIFVGLMQAFGGAGLSWDGRLRPLGAKQLDELTRRHELPLTDEVRAAVESRVQVRAREVRTWGLVGTVVGAIVVWVVSLVARDGDLSPLLLLGTTLGICVGAFRAVRAFRVPLALDAPRVARVRATGIEDYSTVASRRAVLVAAGTVPVALAAAVVVWWLTPAHPSPLAIVGLVACAVVGLVAVLLLRLTAARLVDLPQHAASDLELAWDDSLRAQAVRDFLGSAAGAGLATVLLLTALPLQWVLPWSVRQHHLDLTLWLGAGLGVVFLVSLVAVLVVGQRGAEENPSKRLWTTEAQG